MNELNLAKAKMAGDMKTIIADSEDLLKAMGTVSNESFAGAKAKFEQKLRNAKTALAEASQPMFDRARETATVTDKYVHNNPWTVIGLAAAAGALIGFLTARR